MFIESISYTAAFFAGLLSFFSPCILPLIPAYFTFITGFSLDEMIEGRNSAIRKKAIVSALAYVAGFSFVFILMGASASWFGGLAREYREPLRIVGGAVIILLGIHLTGLFRIRSLDFEKRMHVKKKPLHLIGIFGIGMAFAAGWTPCVGPILGSILIVAGSQESVWQGVSLLGLYSLGLGLPFILISFFINLVVVFIKKVAPTLRYINGVAGALLIIIGALILLDKLYLISG